MPALRSASRPTASSPAGGRSCSACRWANGFTWRSPAGWATPPAAASISSVTVPGQRPRHFANLPLMSKDFRRLQWFGFSSNATKKVEFYVDNVKLVTGEKAPARPNIVFILATIWAMATCVAIIRRERSPPRISIGWRQPGCVSPTPTAPPRSARPRATACSPAATIGGPGCKAACWAAPRRG